MTAGSHNIFLVAASVAISVLAAFTGLAITNNIASLTAPKRKVMVVLSAFILGGGIWSMHFVAMLAHQFPVLVYYDSLQTLGSVLIAILVAGTALLMLHFSTRTTRRLTVAGLILGIGIVVMHYVGMLAIPGSYTLFFIHLRRDGDAGCSVYRVTAVRVAYGHRTKQNIIVGAVVLGFAVVAVHYTAMVGTSFEVSENTQQVQVAMDNHTLAMTVTIAAFVICGAFLLATTTFLTQGPDHELPKPAAPEQDQTSLVDSLRSESIQIPFEKNKKIHYLDSQSVGAIRADGHYTHLYTKDGVYFCPWSITEAEKKLSSRNFHRTHRSYLVNIDAVDNFEKRKETGVCLFNDYAKLSSVPVSRNRIIALTAVLDERENSSEVH